MNFTVWASAIFLPSVILGAMLSTRSIEWTIDLSLSIEGRFEKRTGQNATPIIRGVTFLLSLVIILGILGVVGILPPVVTAFLFVKR